MNNILQLRYAVEVEKTGSISKAAENLYMGQPHLSKAIRELEESLGIVIFNRTSKGVVLTEKGKEFMVYAKNILKQIDEMEALYKHTAGEKMNLNISVPRTSYISYAFTEFIKETGLEKAVSINYRETDSASAINNVADGSDNLAVVRYQAIYEKYFLNALSEKYLEFQPVLEFDRAVLMSKSHPLAGKNVIEHEDLLKYTEIVQGDFAVPALPAAEARRIARAYENKKKITVCDRAGQYELLSKIHTAYMWASPVPSGVLSCFSLVQKPCNTAENKYKDILIYRKGYRMNPVDRLFITKLQKAINAVCDHISVV